MCGTNNNKSFQINQHLFLHIFNNELFIIYNHCNNNNFYYIYKSEKLYKIERPVVAKIASTWGLTNDIYSRTSKLNWTDNIHI